MSRKEHSPHPVFTIAPYNGSRRTATLWRVVKHGRSGFEPVSDPLSRDAAEARERELRAATRPDQTHPFTGTGDVCAYDWPHGDVPSEPCGLPRGRHHQ